MSDLLGKEVNDETIILTSLNRYERKKNIGLAISSFADYLSKPGNDNGNNILVIAGGWDPRVAENVEHEQELIDIAKKHKVLEEVVFLKSISNDQRLLLLKRSNVLLYTPTNEHFGIVPVEAMYMGCIVIACNSGGPLESVADGETGYLIEPDPVKWGSKIDLLLGGQKSDVKTSQLMKMKSAAKERVQNNFTIEVFATNLDKMV